MRRLYHAIRTAVKAVRAGKIQLVDVKGRGEDFTDKELFQQYGFCSRPLPESEGILLFIGGVDNAIVIATEDRRYRLSLQDGEVGLYTDEGDHVHLKRGKEMLIHSGNRVKIEAANTVEVTAPAVILGDGSGKKVLTEDFAALYNGHTHGGGSAPTQQAGSSHMTSKAKAS